MRLGLAVAMVGAILTGLSGSPPVEAAEATVRPALDGVFTAFEERPLVGLADAHGLAEEGDFYLAVVRDPRFAKTIGNVVVEFGGAAHQATLDRYLAGEDVPYQQLRRVWTDVVGWVPTVQGVMYLDFFAQVRAVNRRLPADGRIKVWLGEAPIDWSKIQTFADLKPHWDVRDQFAADLIGREILARQKKALVIYGGSHFDRFLLSPKGPVHVEFLKEIVERRHPGAFYVIRPWTGYPDAGCTATIEREMAAWPKGTIASPIVGTPLERAVRLPGCSRLPPVPPPPPGVSVPTFTPEILRKMEDAMASESIDGLLYLGPVSALTRSPTNPDFYLDTAYFNELSRRNQIITEQPLTFDSWVARFGGPRRAFKPN